MTDTTITDKKGYISSVVDKDKYAKLSDQEKTVFDLIKNSLLEIFPLANNQNKHDDLSLAMAENFAFINLEALKLLIAGPITAKINEITNQTLATITAKTETTTIVK